LIQETRYKIQDAGYTINVTGSTGSTGQPANGPDTRFRMQDSRYKIYVDVSIPKNGISHQFMN
jgi:hypothetical protein